MKKNYMLAFMLLVLGVGISQTESAMEHFKDVKRVKVEDFSLYPNPVAPGRSLRLEVDHADHWELRITGIDGKLLVAKGFTGQQIELALPAMPSGLYLAELRGGGGAVMRRKVLIK